VLCLWLDARLVGPLADIRRKQVTDKLSTAIYTTLCGRQWATAERIFHENPATTASTDVLRRKVHSIGGFSVVLERDYVRFFEDIDPSIAWYTDLARKHKLCEDSGVCEFAVRLAVLPQSLPERYGGALDKLVKQAATNPTVLLGPRFAVLLRSKFGPVDSDRLSRRRGWQ
jgi:hypothetical protein